MKIDINNSIFNLPQINDKGKYFPEYVHEYIKNYVLFLKNSGIETDIINVIEDFSKKIYICLIEYYCGQHDSAKYYFDQAINCINIQCAYATLDKNVFYRARKADKTKVINSDGMFHIPFEERYKVSTQRYSYPGLPCLYLGSSYQVCCDELSDWSEQLYIACIQKNNSAEISVLDLYFFEKYDFDRISDEDIMKFVKMWPLVACCSFVYENPDDMKFRPDYIIPQLLLEYIIDKNADVDITGTGKKVCGIRYHSVTKDFFEHEGKTSAVTYNNYVFPAITNKANGYCSILKEQFEVNWVRVLREVQNEL